MLGEDAVVWMIAHDFPAEIQKIGKNNLAKVMGVWFAGKFSGRSLSSVAAACKDGIRLNQPIKI